MEYNPIPDAVETKSSEEEMVFHYNREERIKKAPKIVQDYYAGDFKAFRPGLFKALVATRGNRFMFFTLIIVVAVIFINGIFNKPDRAFIEHVPLSLSAFSFEENVYVSLCFENPEKKFEKTPDSVITVEFQFLDANKMAVVKQSFTLNYEEKETFLRTTFHDYDIFYISAQVSFRKSDQNLLCTVEKR